MEPPDAKGDATLTIGTSLLTCRTAGGALNPDNSHVALISSVWLGLVHCQGQDDRVAGTECLAHLGRRPTKPNAARAVATAPDGWVVRLHKQLPPPRAVAGPWPAEIAMLDPTTGHLH